MKPSNDDGEFAPTTDTCIVLGIALAHHLPQPLTAQIRRFSIERDRGGRYLPMQTWETIGVEYWLDQLVKVGLVVKGERGEYRLSTAGLWVFLAVGDFPHLNNYARLVYSAPEPVSKLEGPARSWWSKLLGRSRG